MGSAHIGCVFLLNLADNQDGLYQLEELLRIGCYDDKVRVVAHGIIESFDFLGLTLQDTLKSKDEEDRALLLKITTDNSQVMERVREQLLHKGAEVCMSELSVF